MLVGEVRDEVQDADGNTIGYIVRAGLDGANSKEFRYWKQLLMRRAEEARVAQEMGKAG